MSYITAMHMAAMLDELRKEAGVLGGLWANHMAGRYGRQLAVGAGLGAIGGAAAADPGQRLQGAFRGMGLGVGLTGAGQLMTRGGRQALKDWSGKAYQKAKYQFTGRGLPNEPAARLDKARELGLIGEAPTEVSKLPAYNRDVDALNKGYMHIPGMAKGLIRHPGEVLKGAWHRSGTVGKVLTGLSGVSAATELATPSEPGGPGRAERAIGSAAETLGYLAAPAGLLPSLAVGTAAGKAGKLVGRGVDRVGNKLMPGPAAPAPAPVTPAAGGQ